MRLRFLNATHKLTAKLSKTFLNSRRLTLKSPKLGVKINKMNKNN